jgi:hypothetical protein
MLIYGGPGSSERIHWRPDQPSSPASDTTDWDTIPPTKTGKIRDQRHLSSAVTLVALDLAHQLGTRNHRGEGRVSVSLVESELSRAQRRVQPAATARSIRALARP